jgi:hypothetical protein
MTMWHPILAAHESTPGQWWMVDDLGKPYGFIRFVRRGDELGYRADRCDDMGQPTDHVGYFLALKPATVAVHQAFLRSHGANGPPNGTGIVQGDGLNQSAQRQKPPTNLRGD